MTCGSLSLLEEVEGVPGGHVEWGFSEDVERGHRVGVDQKRGYVRAVISGGKVQGSVKVLAEAGSVGEEEPNPGQVILFNHQLQRRCVAVLKV